MSLYGQLLQRRNLPLVGRSMLLAGGLIALGLAAWGLAHLQLDSQRRAEQDSAAQIAALRGELAELEAAQAELDRNLDRFRSLRATGFVGEGDRIGWTEALQRVQRRMLLPDLAFELTAVRALDPLPEELLGQLPEGVAPPLQGTLAHDLRLRISDVHEGEMLALLKGLADEGVGHFRLQRCDWERSADARGMDVDCLLRWISFLPDAAVIVEPAGEAGP